MSRAPSSRRLKAWLGYIPGSVIVAVVAPTVFNTGPAEAGAALATLLVAALTRNLLLAMIVGVSTVVMLRMLVANVR
jgi:uncharacterized membrane protein